MTLRLVPRTPLRVVTDVCAAPGCGLPFTIQEWEDRHTASDGSDVHARCCDLCTIGTPA